MPLILLKIREINAKITLSHSDFPRYKIKGFSEALDFLNERAVFSAEPGGDYRVIILRVAGDFAAKPHGMLECCVGRRQLYFGHNKAGEGIVKFVYLPAQTVGSR